MKKIKKLSDEEKIKINLIVENIDSVNSALELQELMQEKLSLKDLTNAYKKILGAFQNCISNERYFLKIDNLEKATLQHEKKLQLKELLEKIIFMKQQLKNNVILKKENTSFEVDLKNISIRNIRALNYFYSVEDKKLFEQYLQLNEYEDKIEVLEKLRKLYLNITIENYRIKKTTFFEISAILAKENVLNYKNRKNKKAIKKILLKDEYRQLKDELEKVKLNYHKSKLFLKEIERLLTLEKSEYANSIPKKYYDDEEIDYTGYFTADISFAKEYALRLKDIKTGRYIRKYGLGLNFIPKELESLFSKMENLKEEDLGELAILGKDVALCTLKTLKYGKNPYDDLEREFLKKIIDRFNKLIPGEKYSFEKDTSIYYSIMEQLIDDDNNFLYIKDLIENIPNFKDAKRNDKQLDLILNNKNGIYHILFLLEDRFIYNYKLMLINQGMDYINPDFYKEVIKIFLRAGAKLSLEEQQLFDKRLEDFKKYCQDKKYTASGKVCEDIEEIKNYKEEKTLVNEKKLKEEFALLDAHKLDDIVLAYIHSYKPGYFSSNNCCSFRIKGINNFSFTIEKTVDEGYVLGIHCLDTSKLIELDSEIAKYILQGNNIIENLNIKQTYPVVSFLYKLNKKGKIVSDLKIDTSYLASDRIYDKTEIEKIDGFNGFLEELYDNSDVTDIEKLISIKLSKDIACKFVECKIPFIYKVKSDLSEELIADNHNKICHLLSEIPKGEAHKIFDIIDQTKSIYYLPTNTQDGIISVDGATFEGIYLFRILNLILNDKYKIEEEEENLLKIIELLNSKEYLPQGIQEEIKKKLKKAVKEYKKLVKVQ